MKKRIALSFALLAVFIIAIGCGSLIKNSYQALSVSAVAYEQGMASFADLHQQGIVSDAQWEAGYDIAKKYWAAYHSAVEALISYKQVRSVDNADVLKTALQEVSRLVLELINYINPFLATNGLEPITAEPQSF